MLRGYAKALLGRRHQYLYTSLNAGLVSQARVSCTYLYLFDVSRMKYSIIKVMLGFKLSGVNSLSRAGGDCYKHIKCDRNLRENDNEIMRSTVWLSTILLPE
jgi:hypothetical protein